MSNAINRRAFVQGTAAGLLVPASLFAAGKRLNIKSDITALKLNGGETTLSKAMLKELAESLRGLVLLPGFDGFDESRSIWNGMFDDRSPALIVQCSGAADVMTAVTFAREHDLLLAVRSGGHSLSGKSVVEGGMMIDMTRMNEVWVDPKARTARVAGGALLADLDHESQRFGLATTSGTVSHTGAAGLTLGGGLGRLARRYGLASDNLISVDLVTADGQLRHASEDENPELFWGLRGGGGNFGIATSLEYRLHDLGTEVLAGSIMYPMAQAKDVLNNVNEFALKAPPESHISSVVVMPPNGKAFTILSVFYAGDLVKGQKFFEPLINFGKPARASVQPINYVESQQRSDGQLPHGDNYYMKSGFMNALEPEFVDTLIDRFEPNPDRNNVVVISQLGGVASEYAADATAFPNRHSNFDLMIGAQWTDDEASEVNVAWGRDYFDSVAHHTDGFYTNSMMDESDSAIASNFQKNYKRLVALKNEYDPRNQFRLNANVRPDAKI